MELEKETLEELYKRLTKKYAVQPSGTYGETFRVPEQDKILEELKRKGNK